MRFIEKGPPPANVCADGQQEMSFEECERDFLGRLKEIEGDVKRSQWARDYFNGIVKKRLRDALRPEQRSLCVYCEDRVDEPPTAPFPPVEHWRPVSGSHETAVCWQNLYLSCDRDKCCDDQKRFAELASPEGEHLPWPCDFPYERVIGIDPIGVVFVRRNGVLNDELCEVLTRAIGRATDDGVRGDPKSILNLNHPTLCAARLGAITAEAERSKTLSQAEREMRADALLRAPRRVAFVSARVAWLLRLWKSP